MKKKKQRKDHEMDETWLLPYSDMLTLLLALFIVLFAMSEIDVQKYKDLSNIFKSEFSSEKAIIVDDGGEVEIPRKTNSTETVPKDAVNKGADELEQLQNMQNAVNKYISENNLDDTLSTRLTDEGLLITIRNDITFDSGSAVVKSEGIKVAGEISNLLRTDPPHEVVISGHADDRPIHNAAFESNWELSVMRAVNFMSLILDNKELDPTMFSAKGFGEYKPVVPNTSETNRAKNRRVEVLVLPNYEIKTEE